MCKLSVNLPCHYPCTDTICPILNSSISNCGHDWDSISLRIECSSLYFSSLNVSLLYKKQVARSSFINKIFQSMSHLYLIFLKGFWTVFSPRSNFSWLNFRNVFSMQSRATWNSQSIGIFLNFPKGWHRENTFARANRSKWMSSLSLVTNVWSTFGIVNSFRSGVPNAKSWRRSSSDNKGFLQVHRQPFLKLE